MRSWANLPWLFLLAGALVAGACSSADSDPGSGGTGGTGQGGSGPGGNPRGGTTGGSGSGTGGGGGGAGAGGSAASGGSGGASGGAGGGATGGSGVGSDASADASAGTGGSGPSDASSMVDSAPVMIPCTVTLAPLAPQRWANLAAAPGSKLRVGASVTGSQVPAKPTFDWKVTYNGQNVGTTVIGGDPAIVEFETGMVGQYRIAVTVAGVMPACTTMAVASAQPPNNLTAVYRIRAFAPAGRGLAPLETDLPVSVGAMPRKTLELTRGQVINFVATDERPAQLPAYFVQLRSRTSTTRIESFVDNSVPMQQVAKFSALVDERRQIYDLLVIPAPGTSAGVRAPRLYAGLYTEQIQLQDFVILEGTSVSGTVSRGGLPLSGVKVRLRQGLLTSTIGDSNASGRYDLRVRGGRFEVRVVPPADSGLPEAQLAQSAGVSIAEGTPSVNLDFQYAVSLLFTDLNLTVNTPGGSPVSKPVEVLIQNLEGDLANIGGFSGGGNVLANGSVRRLITTTGATASLPKLPTARYRVTVAPPADLPGDLGITSEEIDLREWAATVSRTITLKPRTPVQGRLTGTAPIVGLKVRADDAGEDGFRRTTIVNVASDGAYTIAADPDRLYRVSVEPTVDRTVPRIPLIPFRARPMAVPNTQPLPRILTVKGLTMGEGLPIPGVVIQIYCLGNAPDCVAEESPDVSNTLPIDETVSGADGSYELRIPEPN